MSRELLERVLNELNLASDNFGQLCGEIEAELAKPDAEPFGYWLTHKEGEPCGFRRHPIRPEEHEMIADAEITAEALYTTPQDQSAQISELISKVKSTDESLYFYAGKVDELNKYIAELEKQLADLQNREPVDESFLMLHTSNDELGECVASGFRWAERFHGIGQDRHGFQVKQDQSAKIAELEKQLADLQNKEAVLLSDEQVALCYESIGHYQTLRAQDTFAVFSFARAIERTAHQANGIKVGERWDELTGLLENEIKEGTGKAPMTYRLIRLIIDQSKNN